MATYPGMTLGGEIRESISLDEDDLSDVEDEVFIRDGKNSYKLAEELNVKRPLMAPRRKLGKSDLTSRFKNKPPCKAFCKPCCYIFAALSILIGIIILVVILVSIFPLPLDRLRDWIIFRSRARTLNSTKLLPCSSLNVTDVWTTSLPILTTDSPLRILDLDNDGVEDIIFGFGTGNNYNVLPEDLFCPIFLGVPAPCKGGLIALNGSTGDIIWRYWINDTIFDIHCSADLNGDGSKDCLAIGTAGTIIALDARNGSLLWQQNHHEMDVFVTNIMQDQNNDSVDDILAAHTSLNSKPKEGHLILISGKTGRELKRINIPYQTQTFFMPQLLNNSDGTYSVLFGTGSPNSPGNLSVISVANLLTGNLSNIRTIYEDHYKGVIVQSILVDITGDNISDIVTAMYNSTVVAINGVNFQQIWNYTIPEAESNVVPIPAYFNDDNITDFLIIYEKFDNILNYKYSKTYIINGKTGKPIYTKSISGSVVTQMGGLTLEMESYGFDMFVFWTAECNNLLSPTKNAINVQDSVSDVCQQEFNTSSVMKLNVLNQYDQPPGFEVYNSINRTNLELGLIKSPMKQINDYIIQHPKIPIRKKAKSENDESFLNNRQNINDFSYENPSFRHNRPISVKDLINNNDNSDRPDNIDNIEEKIEEDDQTSNINQRVTDVNVDYEQDNINENPVLYNREMRSKEGVLNVKKDNGKTKKKNLSDPKYGIYDYQNIKMSKNRLLHDLNNVPWDILRDTYFKNRENQLRKSKFEQRDITSHLDKIKENEDVKRIIDEERRKSQNASYTLWDLESEKERQDKENGLWRGKREINLTLAGMRKVTSVGAVVKSGNTTRNSVDIVFVTYWQPSQFSTEDLFEQEIKDCLKEKLASDQSHLFTKNTAKEQQDLYMEECRNEQNVLKSFAYYNQIYQLRLGQMTVYRIRVECKCDVQNSNERCAKFLPQNEQSWNTYLGKLENGIFRTKH